MLEGGRAAREERGEGKGRIGRYSAERKIVETDETKKGRWKEGKKGCKGKLIKKK